MRRWVLAAATTTLAFAQPPQKQDELRTRPECAKSFAAGLAEYGRKDFTQALIAFRAAAQCDARLTAAQLAIADIYAERGNESEALAALLQVLQVEPKNLLALRAGSNLYLKNGLHTKALPLLETLVTVDAGSPDAHADLAAVYAASGNRDGAEKEFRRALELRPGYFPALAGLGNLLARGGDDAAALPLLRKAVEAQPGAYEGHFLLGSALNRQGLFAEAAMELEKAARSDAGSREPQVFYQLARALGGLNKAAERKDALVRFSELTKREKESTAQQREASALVDQARELVQAGNLEEAAKRLELAREARPGDGSLLFRLAGLHFDLGRFATAREYVQAAISISPATWLYHYLLGLVERADGRTTEARASLEVAAKLEPKEAPVWNTLGEVLLEQREAKAAAAAFQKAVELSPGDETYKRNLDAARRP